MGLWVHWSRPPRAVQADLTGGAKQGTEAPTTHGQPRRRVEAWSGAGQGEVSDRLPTECPRHHPRTRVSAWAPSIQTPVGVDPGATVLSHLLPGRSAAGRMVDLWDQASAARPTIR